VGKRGEGETASAARAPRPPHPFSLIPFNTIFFSFSLFIDIYPCNNKIIDMQVVDLLAGTTAPVHRELYGRTFHGERGVPKIPAIVRLSSLSLDYLLSAGFFSIR
jgi:hypothetical protein